MSALPLVGRGREIASIDGRLAAIEQQGGGLVIRGEAGVGKSALLDAAKLSAAGRGMRVLTTQGFESEAHIAFAGLHRLLKPLLSALDRLPAPQRAAMQAAFGLQETTAPDFFLIALAALDLLCEAGQEQPLLVVIEDAERLDVATCDALMFVARRLEAEAILMLFAVREQSGARIDRAALPALALQPLDDQAAAAVLDANEPDLAPGSRRRILAEAAGNPLALLELPGVLAAGFDPSLETPLPLNERLERAFAQRVSDLSPSVRTLLLVAALDDGGDQERIFSAASSLAGKTIGIVELAAAQDAGAIAVEGDGLHFRHPLVRSAIYQHAVAPERRAAHRALAMVYRGDPDRGVWFEAASLAGPDDRLAGELEAVAERAAQRGAGAASVAAFDRAARLTADDADRGRLLLRAATLAYDLGHHDVSVGLVREAQRLKLADREQALLRYLLELVQDNAWSGAAGIRSLVAISGELCRVGELDRAVDALELASLRCWWENPDQEIRDLVVAASRELFLGEGSPRALAILAQADPVRHGAATVEQIARRTPDPTDPAGMYLVGMAANAVWAYDLGLVFLNGAVEGLRAQGRLGLLARALVAQAWAAVHLAREPLAVCAAEEAIALSRETGQSRWLVDAQLAKATIAAERGDVDATEALVREAEAVIVPMGAMPMLALVQFVRGRAAVAHQNHAEGFGQLRRALDPADPAYHPFVGAWGLSDLVEAATHTGKSDTAQACLDQLESLADRTSGSLLQAERGYARPMVADDDTAEALYMAALGTELANWPCYRARMLLWYGRWLRRQRRAVDSREPLRAALDAFDALAFPQLASTARQELRASGEKPDERMPEAWARLTPQELQIAQLASAGFTNRAIGQQLFLSPRTVQSHLYRIFPKLGITARSQLRDAFPDRDPGYLGSVGANSGLPDQADQSGDDHRYSVGNRR